MSQNIHYQGEPGAYSHLACSTFFPDRIPIPCQSFAAAFAAVRNNPDDLAMIPVDNSVAGRVSDIYHLLPEGGLSIIGEHYLPVHHNLWGIPGATQADIKIARSHPMALGQVRRRLVSWDIQPKADSDTAGAARRVSERGDKTVGAVASALAGKIYGLDLLAKNIEDADHNTTRFLVLAARGGVVPALGSPVVTSFVFRVRSVPSALYKALGGFASNGINITKLESYMVGGSFTAAQFYMDVEAHPDSEAMCHAMDELKFFSEEIIVLGTYPADSVRSQSR
ncbi:MAG: prephenate dehydratase [Hellea sp.]|nr:prephenate dehydratase [Hellea sp.]